MTLSRRDAITRIGGLLAIAVVRPGDLRLPGHKPFEHPDPRPGITGENVLGADKLPNKKKVRAAYDAARRYPEIFDGVLCVCDCKGSMGHRSILACFESDQAVGCMACREVAELIEPLATLGKSLAEIRQAVDKEFG